MIDASVETFHVLNLCGTNFFIDLGTRREIEQFLSSATKSMATLTIEDVTGAEVLVVANGVSAMWESSPDIRDRDREIRAVLEAEEKQL